jgi:hypothetical protein
MRALDVVIAVVVRIGGMVVTVVSRSSPLLHEKPHGRSDKLLPAEVRQNGGLGFLRPVQK